MSGPEETALLRMMCVCWREGSLPDDDAQLLRLTKLNQMVNHVDNQTITTWLNHVKTHFKQMDGKLFYEPFLKAREESFRLLEKRKRAGELGVKARQEKRLANQPHGNHMVTTPNNHMVTTSCAPTPTPTQTTPIPPFEKGESVFEKFWELYPRKISKEHARKEFKKLKLTVEDGQKLLVAVERQRKSPMWQKEAGRFIPFPRKWLEEKRWLDDYAAPALEPTCAACGSKKVTVFKDKKWWCNSACHKKGEQA